MSRDDGYDPNCDRCQRQQARECERCDAQHKHEVRSLEERLIEAGQREAAAAAERDFLSKRIAELEPEHAHMAAYIEQHVAAEHGACPLPEWHNPKDTAQIAELKNLLRLRVAPVLMTADIFCGPAAKHLAAEGWPDGPGTLRANLREIGEKAGEVLQVVTEKC